MRNIFFIVTAICIFLFLTCGIFWVPADAGTTSTMVISGNMPLICYNMSATGISSENATITWRTNGLTNSTVEYGTATDYGTTSADNLMNISHSIRLDNLSSGTRYHYQILSKTNNGLSCTSPDRTLKTLLPAGTIAATATKGTTFTGVTTSTVAGAQQVSLDLSTHGHYQ
jgi:phosphodiesterase/alkaline phosphatase D-like protein